MRSWGTFSATTGEPASQSNGCGHFRANGDWSDAGAARFTVGEIELGLAVKLPNQRLLPIAPILVASALAIRQREQHERIEGGLTFHACRESGDGCRPAGHTCGGRAWQTSIAPPIKR